MIDYYNLYLYPQMITNIFVSRGFIFSWAYVAFGGIMGVGFYIQTEGKKMTEKEQKIIDLLHDSEYEMLIKLDEVCKNMI